MFMDSECFEDDCEAVSLIAAILRFADGTQTSDNSTYGAWLVMNTKDTYFGGPLHSDLMVDGIVYNYVNWLDWFALRL